MFTLNNFIMYTQITFDFLNNTRFEYSRKIGQKYSNLNRYPNVLPYDNNISVHKNDISYINASNIIIHKYMAIATQAPLPQTFNDFWLMIYIFRSDLIVMLTKIIENNKVKANIYFPTEINKVEYFKNISIELINQVETVGIITRQFKLFHQLEKKEHHVTHIQYTQWPDFGVPDDNDYDIIKNITKTVLKNLKIGSIPVIHCSAGIGRTGVLLSILNYIVLKSKCKSKLKFIEETLNTDINTIIINLRSQRKGIVQTFEQYDYIHNFLIKYYYSNAGL